MTHRSEQPPLRGANPRPRHSCVKKTHFRARAISCAAGYSSCQSTAHLSCAYKNQPHCTHSILCCTSQVYKGLDVTTNKVAGEERAQIPHHLLDFVGPLDQFTVIDYRDKALDVVCTCACG